MRLLNIYTYELRQFAPGEVPPYVIASHRWLREDREATFRDVPLLRPSSISGLRQLFKAARDEPAPEKPGITKIRLFCKFAARRFSYSKQCTWLWIDTICINKESSSELSEAINSMYRWYAEAECCIVWLLDLVGCKQWIMPWSEPQKEAFTQSTWFTRGWTLQELLAPPLVIFVDQIWDIIGTVPDTKGELTPSIHGVRQFSWPDIMTYVSDATGIGLDILDGSTPMASVSAEVKSSWLAGRQTTRPEDLAYCMQGLYGVYMVPIYGEGFDNAWSRLIEEVSKKARLPMAAAHTQTAMKRNSFRPNPMEHVVANRKPGITLGDRKKPNDRTRSNAKGYNNTDINNEHNEMTRRAARPRMKDRTSSKQKASQRYESVQHQEIPGPTSSEPATSIVEHDKPYEPSSMARPRLREFASTESSEEDERMARLRSWRCDNYEWSTGVGNGVREHRPKREESRKVDLDSRIAEAREEAERKEYDEAARRELRRLRRGKRTDQQSGLDKTSALLLDRKHSEEGKNLLAKEEEARRLERKLEQAVRNDESFDEETARFARLRVEEAFAKGKKKRRGRIEA